MDERPAAVRRLSATRMLNSSVIAIVFLAAATCAYATPATIGPSAIEEFRQQLVSESSRLMLADKKIVMTGFVHAVAAGSIFLDLRDRPSQYLGTGEEQPGIQDCIGLVMTKDLFEKIRGNHDVTIAGTIFLVTVPQNVMVSSIDYKGLRFYPMCGFYTPDYPYILVTSVTRKD